MNFQITLNKEEKLECIKMLRYKGDINSIEFIKLNDFLSIIGILNFDFVDLEDKKNMNKIYTFRYCIDGFNVVQKNSNWIKVCNEIQTGYLKNLDFLATNITKIIKFARWNEYLYIYNLSEAKKPVTDSCIIFPFYGLRYGFLCCGKLCYDKNNLSYKISITNTPQNLLSLEEYIKNVGKSYIRSIYPEAAEIYDVSKILVDMKRIDNRT